MAYVNNTLLYISILAWETPKCKVGDLECLPKVMTYYLKNGGAGEILKQNFKL